MTIHLQIHYRKIKYITAFCILLLFSFTVNAQVSDSLYKVLPDTLRPRDRNHLSDNEIRNIISKSWYSTVPGYGKELDEMAKDLESKTYKSADSGEIIKNTMAVGEYIYTSARSNAQEDEALLHFKKVIYYIGKKNQYDGIAATANTYIGEYYSYRNLLDSAINYLHQGFDAARVLNDSSLLSFIYSNYATIYAKLGLKDKAIFYSEGALKYYFSKGQWDNPYTILYLNSSAYYLEFFGQTRIKKYADFANQKIRKLMEVKQSEAAHWFEACYAFLGSLAYYSKEYKTAISLFDSSMRPFYNRSSFYFKNNYYIAPFFKGVCLVKLGRYNEGKNLLNNIHMLPTKWQHLTILNEALYECDSAAKNWKGALLYYRKYKAYLDSLDLNGQKERIFATDQKYLLSQNEAMIEKLKNQSLQKEKTKGTIATGSIISVLVLVIIVLLLYLNNKKQQADRKKEREDLTTRLQKMEEDINQELEMVTAENLAAMTNQRKNISQNMHDEISSSIAALQYYIADLRLNAVHEETKNTLRAVEEEAHDVHRQARSFIHNLYNTSMQAQYDVILFLDGLANRFGKGSSLYVQTTIDTEHIGRYFTPLFHQEIYLFIKEAVVNTMKHSGANRLNIGLLFNNGRFHLTIADNGVGTVGGTEKGIGIKNLKKRMDLLGGNLEIDFNKNGTTLTGIFPALAENVN